MEHKIVTIEVGQKIQDVLDSNELSDVVIYKDDLLVSTDYISKENDVFYIYVIPEGGDTFKTLVKIAVMVAVAVYAPQLYVYMGGTAGGYGAALFTAFATVATAMALNKLLPPDVPTTGDSLGSDSATYGWGDPSNQKAEGAILPILLGTHRVKPPYINAYISTEQDGVQTLNQLFAVNLGEVDTISNITINNNNIENYTNTTFHTRMGTTDQSVIGSSPLEPDFTKARTDFNQYSRVLNTNWYNFQTFQEVEKIGLTLTFQGLAQFDDSGNLNNYEVECEAQYSIDNINWSYFRSMDFTPEPTKNIKYKGGHRILVPTNIGAKAETVYYWVDNGGDGYIQNSYQTVSYGGISVVGSKTGEEVLDNNGTTWYKYNGSGYGYEYKTVNSGDGDYYSYEAVGFNTYWSTNVNETTGSFSGDGGSLNLVGMVNHLSCLDNTQEARIFYFETNTITPGNYYVRIRRKSEDSTSTRILDKCIFTSHSEYLAGVSQRYPSVALLAIKALATDQLSGNLPTVSALVSRVGKDLDKPLYNPAWACRHLILEHLNGNVNETKFSEWAEYCTSNGYTVNIYIETQMSFKKVLDMIASLGQGYIFQKGLEWDCRWEAYDTAPVQAFIFNDSNIAYDSYNEQYLSVDERFNTLELTYFDETLEYERNTIIMQQDNVDIERKTNLVLYGCTSRTMAIKLGKVALRKMRYETLISSWSCDIDALHCGLYDIVYIQHSVPKWSNGSGGLIQSANLTSITLDQNVVLTPGVSYRVRIQHIDTDVVDEVFTVPTSQDLVTDTLYFVSNLTTIPSKNSKYTFNDGRYFKIVNISKLDDLRTKITAVEYVPEIYNVSVDVPVIDYTPEKQISNISFIETLAYDKQGNVEGILNISFVSNYLSNQIFISTDDITYTKYGQPSFSNNKNIYGLIGNTTYYFKINETKTTHFFLGKFAKPNDIDSLSGSEVGNVFTLNWEHEANNIDIDFLEYVIYYGDDEIGRTKNKTFEYYSYGLEVKTFTVKSIDTSAVLSDGVSINLQAVAPEEVSNLSIIEGLDDWELSWSYGYIPTDFKTFQIYQDYDLVGETAGFIFKAKITQTQSKFRVIAIDTVGNQSTYTEQTKTIATLEDISTINTTYLNNTLLMFWATIKSDKSPIVYEIRKGTLWSNAQFVEITQDFKNVIYSNGTYLVKPTYTFASGFKIEAENAIVIVADEVQLSKNELVTWNEATTGWSGIKTNVIVDTFGNILLDNMTGMPIVGTYEIPNSHIVNLTEPKICKLSYNLESFAFAFGNNFDDYVDVDLISGIDNVVTVDYETEVQISISQDGVNYDDYRKFISGDYLAQSFKFRILMKSYRIDVTPYVTNFEFTVDMPDVYEAGSDVTTTSNKTINYVNSFTIPPDVQITIVNASAGDDAILTNQTTESFDIIIKNSGVNVARTFNYFVKGY
jgi:hypothetical protein